MRLLSDPLLRVHFEELVPTYVNDSCAILLCPEEWLRISLQVFPEVRKANYAIYSFDS
jgi:hypothetical protein